MIKLIAILLLIMPRVTWAQDTAIDTKPKIVKIGILHSILLASRPELGINAASLSFEKFRNKKTAFNILADYFHIQENKLATTGFYYPSQNEPLFSRHIFSLRFLYRRYLFQNTRILKGLYIAGGANLAKRFLPIHTVIDYRKIYIGLGVGLGYQIVLSDRFSIEILHHRAYNGMPLFPTNSDTDRRMLPIGVIITDITVGYNINRSRK